MRRPRHLLTVTAVLAVLVAGCGGSTSALGSGGDDPAAASDSSSVAADLPDLPGCDLAAEVAPELEDALAETLDTEAAPGPAVLTDDGEGGRTLTTTLVVDGGEAYEPVSFAVVEGPGGPSLAPLTDAGLAVSRDGVDASRVLGPDGQVVRGDTPGSAGMALGEDCSLVLAQELQPPPPRPAPAVAEDLLVVTPATVTPGTVVQLTFPEETMRGIAFQLDEHEGDGWTTRWWMTSDANGGEPATVPADTSGFGAEDVGIGGPGPDRVLVHPDTEPGEYRLCTANALEDVCALLTVEAG